LAKDAEQRRVECEARAAQQTAPHYTEGRRQYFERIAAHDFAGEDRPATLIPVQRAFHWLRQDPEARQQLLRLVLHVDRYMDAIKQKSLRNGGRLIYGLANLVRHHRRWLRPVESWTPQHRRRDGQFASLARHLLAHYDVPVFMDSVWFVGRRERGLQRQEWYLSQGIDERGLQLQEWFIHVGMGGNIRDMDTPIRLTRRMAHVFLAAPARDTVERNLRWAQVIGLGGDERLAQAILRTRLGRRFENDDFWSSVVLFLVNNAMMDPSWVGPVVDYVHHMKYAPRRVVQEGGGVEEALPPQPEFIMKGRSATKLLGQVEAWHGQLSREQYVDFQSWQPCGVRPFEVEDETEELGQLRWTVQELLSSWELAAEGRAMSHCVVSYSNQCAEGNIAVWSICAQRPGAAERENVLTVALDLEERTVTQARGRYNALPNQRPNTAKTRREAQTGYFALLNRSDHILKEWIVHERLRRSG
jgi:hypothetical protein